MLLSIRQSLLLGFILYEEKPSHYIVFILAYLFLGLRYSLISFPQFHSGVLAIFSGGKLFGVIILFFLVGKFIQKENSLKKLPE
jgi:hypothetical protein